MVGQKSGEESIEKMKGKCSGKWDFSWDSCYYCQLLLGLMAGHKIKNYKIGIVFVFNIYAVRLSMMSI